VPSFKLLLIVPLLFAVMPAIAQQRSVTTQSQTTVGGSRTAVAIQPPSTNNPFKNPIGQGVAPAANANSNRNNTTITTSPAH
jgi:ABC-type sugar transport system substrate-binding protein